MSEGKHPLEDAVLASIQKNGFEHLRIEVAHFKGRRQLSMRIWVERRDGSLVPTRKGFACSADLLPQIVEALQAGMKSREVTAAQASAAG